MLVVREAVGEANPSCCFASGAPMKTDHFFLVCFQLAVLLCLALAAGRLMQWLRQPAVVGEMAVGLLVGPTVFGALWPQAQHWLFASSESAATVRDQAVELGMLFFLFRSGLEVNFSEARRLGWKVLSVGLTGTLVPLAIGIGLTYALPRALWGGPETERSFSFALFIGMSLANSANPVIARILMDLGLLKTDLGRLIMASTVVDDLVNWLLFATIAANLAPDAETANTSGLAGWMVSVALLFLAVFGLGRLIGTRLLRWGRTVLTVPHAYVGIVAVLVLIAGGVTARLGVHAFFGAFLIGVALGSEEEERQDAQQIIKLFVLGFFAPVYFATMALEVDFVRHFSLALALIISVVAFAAKLLGVALGARFAGMPLKRETWALGFGLNARGATGIILAKVGFDQGIIHERAFVALVLMCLATSMASGPAMQAVLHRKHASANTENASS